MCKCKTVNSLRNKLLSSDNDLTLAKCRILDLETQLKRAKQRGDGWKDRALMAEDRFEGCKQLFPNVITAYTSADGIKGFKHPNGGYMIVRTHEDSYWNIPVQFEVG